MLSFGIYLYFGACILTFLNITIPGIVSLKMSSLSGIVPLCFIRGFRVPGSRKDSNPSTPNGEARLAGNPSTEDDVILK
jgi:hypothetical protein